MWAFSPLDEVESSILLVFANTNPPLLCLTALSNNADESCNCILMGRLERPETFRGKEEKKSKERTEQPSVPGPSLQASEAQPVPERRAELPTRVHGVNRLQGAGRARFLLCHFQSV